MEKIEHDSTQYAIIKGVGMIVLANMDDKMTLNQAINAKSYQSGMFTKYHRQSKGYMVPERLRCFISLCNIRRDEFKQAPNRSRYYQPDCY